MIESKPRFLQGVLTFEGAPASTAPSLCPP